jgi:hypothetical protein
MDESIEGKPYYALDFTYCFILNEEGDAILKDCKIEYGATRFGSDNDLRLIPVEVLGCDIQ